MRAFGAPAIMLIAVHSPAAFAATGVLGRDDGSSVGGPNVNSTSAESSILNLGADFGPVYTLDFEDSPLGYSSTYYFPGVTVGITSADFGPGFTGITNFNQGTIYGFDVDSGSGTWFGPGEAASTWSFASPTNTFGFYATGTQAVYAPNFTVSFDGDDAQTFTIDSNDEGGTLYFGFTSPSAFSTVTITSLAQDAWGLDRVSYNLNVAAVPEPAAWAMLLFGFGAVGSAVRIRKRSRLPA